jgi:hypothetical protein
MWIADLRQFRGERLGCADSGHLTSNIRSHVGYFDWTPPAQPFEKPAPYHRPDTGATLIAVPLLSLGLWAAIWGAVAALFSAVL